MDDLLTGYLLDALDPADRRAVEARLCDDPAARRKLVLLRQSLAPLAADRGDPDPPPGLVARTLARVPEDYPPRVRDRPPAGSARPEVARPRVRLHARLPRPERSAPRPEPHLQRPRNRLPADHGRSAGGTRVRSERALHRRAGAVLHEQPGRRQLR